jgi:hypothetical protein
VPRAGAGAGPGAGGGDALLPELPLLPHETLQIATQPSIETRAQSVTMLTSS